MQIKVRMIKVSKEIEVILHSYTYRKHRDLYLRPTDVNANAHDEVWLERDNALRIIRSRSTERKPYAYGFLFILLAGSWFSANFEEVNLLNI